MSLGTLNGENVFSCLALALVLSLAACAAQRGHARRALHYARYRLMRPGVDVQCDAQADLSFCRYRPKGLEEDPQATIYFLHYAGGNARSLARVGLANAFYGVYRRKHLKPPRIVALSFGTHWIVSDRPGRRQTVTTRRLLDQTLPLLERRFGAAPRRLLWGMSQGGYNALELALAYPGRWQAAVVSCPALLSVDPFSEEAPALAKRARVPLGTVRDGLALFNTRLADSATWRSEEPIARVRAGASLPPLLIQTSLRDEFGFREGSLSLAKALSARPEGVTLEDGPDGHCLFDARSVAEFFIARQARRSSAP